VTFGFTNPKKKSFLENYMRKYGIYLKKVLSPSLIRHNNLGKNQKSINVGPT
jgi:hypothetical protein